MSAEMNSKQEPEEKCGKELKTLLSNFRNQKPSEILLWSGIAIGAILFSLAFFGWWYACLIFIVIIVGRFYNMQAERFLTICAISLAAIGLLQQNHQLKEQLLQYQLDKRPYLFTDFKYFFDKRDGYDVFGSWMIFRNKGKFPASDIQASYLVCDEKKCDDFKRWYHDTYGGYPEVSVVPPDEETSPQIYAPGISKDAKLACVGVVVNYKGLKNEKTYWYKRLDIVRILRDQNGNPIRLLLLNTERKWDENNDVEAPSLKAPDWSLYKRKDFGEN